MKKRIAPLPQILTREQFDAEVAALGSRVEFNQESTSLSHAYGVIFRNRKGTFTARWFNERKKD